jgi:hypothetical protein
MVSQIVLVDVKFHSADFSSIGLIRLEMEIKMLGGIKQMLVKHGHIVNVGELEQGLH